MGKNKTNDFRDMGNLMEEKKKLEKKIKQMSIPCPHLNKRGEIKIDMLKGNQCRCKRCGLAFGIEQYSNDTVTECIRVVHDVLNQIKVFSDDPDADATLIKTLGELDYNLSTVPDIYTRAISERNGGKKKKKNGGGGYNEFGTVGRDISFVNGGNKKKNRW